MFENPTSSSATSLNCITTICKSRTYRVGVRRVEEPKIISKVGRKNEFTDNGISSDRNLGHPLRTTILVIGIR